MTGSAMFVMKADRLTNWTVDMNELRTVEAMMMAK